MLLWNNWHFYITPFLIVAYAISILLVVLVVILENRSPLKTIAWSLVLLLLPGLGIIFYVFFGQNLRKEKIIARKGLKNHESILSLANAQITKLSEGNLLFNKSAKRKRNIVQLLLNNSSSIFTVGNKVKILINGESTFDSIIEAIQLAKCFIHLEYYIFEDDEIGRRIKNLLIEKSLSGVEVRVIVDDVGSWELKTNFFKELRLAGIEIESFLKVRFPWFTSKVNYRNHRKIVVVDGLIGFMGGINIADRYLNGSEEYGIWRDTHLKVEGDAVKMLQTIFLIDWYFVKQIELADLKYFPSKEPFGDTSMQITASGPDSDWPAIMMGIFEAIASAENYVYIATPYFMPSESVLMAIKSASMGGVDVRILIPFKSDAFITLLSSRSYIKELLEAGVKVYQYERGFLHSKTLVVDDLIASIGSANMDFRSFEQNYEVTSFIYDEMIAQQLRQIFMDDLRYSSQIILEVWSQRSVWQKSKESFARLFSPLL
ncbi:MAG: cardiolipin synthase [Marinilabiliaceae bacterium]|nr:cardiolipin synthase [Marinilabiliaceae bacterium]